MEFDSVPSLYSFITPSLVNSRVKEYPTVRGFETSPVQGLTEFTQSHLPIIKSEMVSLSFWQLMKDVKKIIRINFNRLDFIAYISFS